MIKAVIFDMDGVIFDSEKLWKDALKDLKKKYGLKTITEAVRRKSCGMDINQQNLYFKPYMPEGLDVNDFALEWQDLVLKKLITTNINITKPGFEEIYDYFKNKGYKIGLNSGSPRELIKLLFHRAGFDETEMFDFIISGDDLTLGKPDPEGYVKACKGLGFSPTECIVLEDSTNGIVSGTGAGCHVINVLDIIVPPKRVQKKCLYVAKSLKDTLNYFQENEI